MVMRPAIPFKTPPSSRGISPSRIARKSPARTPPELIKRSPSLRSSHWNVLRKIGSRGTSPAKSENTLTLLSRGSDTGSIEILHDGNANRRIATDYNEEDNINVVVRVRPLNNREIKAGDTSVIQFPGNGQILCDGIPGGPSGGIKSKLFSYNVVFEPAATQEDVLQFSGMKRLIEMAVEGFRCTAFCYGQTGSGKTHTLTGPPGLFGKRPQPYSDQHGLVFRSFLYLFQLLQEKPEVHYILKASFLEIYNEKVIDLLNPGSARKPLAVRWSKKARGFFVENLFTVDCEELDDLMAVLEEGMRNRSVGSHNMNEYSSRSHTILTVHITSETPAEGGVFISRSGKINFVDLAGSEMTKKTHSEGKTLEEANNINKSLMVLGYCIASLSDPRRKNNHIPYRDSKLTKLLADSLAGNGVTLMIACISPARSNLCETVNTLRYAARAKKIKTKPVILMDPREALILSLKREVNVLLSENEHLRSALHVYVNNVSNEPLSESQVMHAPPGVDLDKLADLEGAQLVELVKLYLSENDALRKENSELYQSRDVLLHDQEVVCRENERLLKKLEDVNSVCCRSPLIAARGAISNEFLDKSAVDIDASSANIWRDPLEDSTLTKSSSYIDLPQSIQKELDKRRIGESALPDIRNGSHSRQNSWEGRPNLKTYRIRSSESDGGKPLDPQSVKNERFSSIGSGVSSLKRPQVDSASRRFSIANSNQSANTRNPENSRVDASPSSNDYMGRHVLDWSQGQGIGDDGTKPEIFGSAISLAENADSIFSSKTSL